MKLADFKNEEALDFLDKVLEPVSTIITDPEIMALRKQNKSNVLLASAIVKNHKKDIIEIIAAMHKKTPETVEFTIPSLLKDVNDLLDDPDLNAVFTSQSQTKVVTYSGSATASIAGALA